jgi:transcriptional regulator with XRE-family HTH domain
MRTVAERVHYARVARGLGVNELDRALGKQQGYTSTLEKTPKRTPRIETLELLRKALDVPFDWLAYGKGPSGLEGLPVEEPAARVTPPADDRHPNREVALATLQGLVAPAIETAMRTVRLSRDDDPTVDEWIEMTMAMQRRRDRAQAELAAGKAAPVVGSDEQVVATVQRLSADAVKGKKRGT